MIYYEPSFWTKTGKQEYRGMYIIHVANIYFDVKKKEYIHLMEVNRWGLRSEGSEGSEDGEWKIRMFKNTFIYDYLWIFVCVDVRAEVDTTWLII